jgi:hypothetical protein
MFIDKDLPNQGQHHFQALYITLDMKEKRVPMVLIDNESALNVCPLKNSRMFRN